jgi:hypothetical protein
MADGTVGVKQSATADRLIDNETLVIGGETVYRQRVQIPEAVQTRDLVLVPKGHQQILSATLAAVTALTVPGGAVYAQLHAWGETVRYRDDGPDPTSGVGMRLVKDTTIFYTASLSALRFIREVSGANLEVLFYGVS